MKSKIIILSRNTYMENIENKKITRLEFVKTGAKWLVLGATGGLLAELACGGGGGDDGDTPPGPVTPGCGDDIYDCDGYPKAQKTISGSVNGVTVPSVPVGKVESYMNQSMTSGLLDGLIKSPLHNQAQGLLAGFPSTDTMYFDGKIHAAMDSIDSIGLVGAQDATEMLHDTETQRANIKAILESYMYSGAETTKFQDLMEAFEKGHYLAQANVFTNFNKFSADSEMTGIYTDLGIPTVDPVRALATATTQLIDLIQTRLFVGAEVVLSVIRDWAKFQRWTKDVLDTPGINPTTTGLAPHYPSVPCVFFGGVYAERQFKKGRNVAMRKDSDGKIV